MRQHAGWFHVASHLSMPVAACMRKITHREFLGWLYWLESQWNEPSRSDYYLMQVAAEVRRVLRKNPSKIKTEHLLIKFVPKKPQKNIIKRTIEEVSKAAKARWGQWVGLK